MKKSLLLVALCMLAVSRAFAVNGNDVFILQQDPTNTYQWYKFITFTADGLFGWEQSTHLPKPIVIGSGLSLDTTNWILSASGNSRSFNHTPSRSIVTVAAAANGWQIDAIRDSAVSYSVTVVTTATIAGAASGYVVLEIAATNSSTAGDWIEVGRTGNGQALSLAVTLQSVQTVPAQINCIVPAGYYVRLRSVNVAGTPSYTYNSGQEVKL